MSTDNETQAHPTILQTELSDPNSQPSQPDPQLPAPDPATTPPQLLNVDPQSSSLQPQNNDLCKVLPSNANQSPAPFTQNPPPPHFLPAPARRRNGKVAHYCKEIRDEINSMMDEGRRYSEIIKELRKRKIVFTHQNLSNWYKGGYQDWLREKQWFNLLRARQETFCDLIPLPDEAHIQITEAALQLTATQVCQHLRDLSLAARNPDTKSDTDSLSRLLDILCRVNRELFEIQKYYDKREFDYEKSSAETRELMQKSDEVRHEARDLVQIYRQLHPKYFKDESPDDPEAQAAAERDLKTYEQRHAKRHP